MVVLLFVFPKLGAYHWVTSSQFRWSLDLAVGVFGKVGYNSEYQELGHKQCLSVMYVCVYIHGNSCMCACDVGMCVCVFVCVHECMLTMPSWTCRSCWCLSLFVLDFIF